MKKTFSLVFNRYLSYNRSNHFVQGCVAEPMKKIFTFFVYHPLLTLSVLLLLGSPFLLALPRLKTANNIDFVTVDNNAEIAFYKKFKKVFDVEEMFVIVFQKKDIFQPRWLNLIRDVTDELSSWESINKVHSLTNVDDIIGGKDYFEVKKFLDPIPGDPAALAQKKAAALANPLYRNLLISKDGRTAAIVVEPVVDEQNEDFRIALFKKVNTLLDPYREKDHVHFYIAGPSFMNLRMGESIVKDMRNFIPISFVAMVIIAALIFLNLRIAFLSFLNMGVAMIATFGFMALAHITMNNFTGLAPTVIMAISLASVIHIFSHYKHYQHFQPPKEAMIGALMETYRPSLFTVLTTGIGFSSLMISHIPPIREFGAVAAVGIGSIFIITFSFAPAMMSLVLRRPFSQRKDLHHELRAWMIKLGAFLKRHARAVFWAHVAAMAVSLLLIPRIPVDTKLVDWFKAGTDVRAANDFIDHNLVPVSSLSLDLSGTEDAFKEPVNLRYLDRIESDLKTRPDIKKTLSFADFIKDMNQSFHGEDPAYYRIPESRALVAQYLILYNSDDIDEYITSDYSQARLLLRTIYHGSHHLGLQVASLQAYLKKNPPPRDLKVHVTDAGTETIQIAKELVRNQMMTLILTVLSISILLFLVFLSWKLGFISLVPNIFPVILNFGIMGLFKIPLNTGTAMISATVFGIVVDDTIHLLYHYQTERKAGVSATEAIQRAMTVKGPAVVTTSVVLFCGFAVAVTGTMMPVVQFGILTSIIMVTALMGDLLFMPSVLNLLPNVVSTKDNVTATQGGKQ